MAIFKNDVGTILTITVVDDDGVAVDISGATSKQIVFLKPDETVVTKTAVFVSDGSDGKIKYTTIAGDLDIVGLWHIQPLIDISAGDVIFHADYDHFEVLEPLSG